MAENKKSFVAYCDWQETFNALPDEVAGKLIKHIFAYVNDENPETDDVLINAVFANIKHTLKRDLDKYEHKRKQQSEAGKKSASVRKERQRKSTNVKERSTDSTDSVSVSDNVSVSDTIEKRKSDFQKKVYAFKENDKMLLSEFISYWTESNEGGKKMRFELAKNQPFNIGRRLGTWKKNQRNFNRNATEPNIDTEEGFSTIDNAVPETG